MLFGFGLPCVTVILGVAVCLGWFGVLFLGWLVSFFVGLCRFRGGGWVCLVGFGVRRFCLVGLLVVWCSVVCVVCICVVWLLFGVWCSARVGML